MAVSDGLKKVEFRRCKGRITIAFFGKIDGIDVYKVSVLSIAPRVEIEVCGDGIELSLGA